MVYSTADTFSPCDIMDCGEHGECKVACIRILSKYNLKTCFFQKRLIRAILIYVSMASVIQLTKVSPVNARKTGVVHCVTHVCIQAVGIVVFLVKRFTSQHNSHSIKKHSIFS